MIRWFMAGYSGFFTGYPLFDHPVRAFSFLFASVAVSGIGAYLSEGILTRGRRPIVGWAVLGVSFAVLFGGFFMVSGLMPSWSSILTTR